MQIVIVPAVQARNRRRERWENDVAELVGLLEEQLPRAFDSFKSAANQVRWMRPLKGNEEYNQERLAEVLQAAEAERREASKAVGDQMARLDILGSRIRRTRPKAPYWRRVSMQLIGLRFAAWEVEDDFAPLGDPNELLDDASWKKAWTTLGQRQKELTEELKKVADPMRPPPQKWVRRSVETARGRLAGRKGKAPKALVAESSVNQPSSEVP